MNTNTHTLAFNTIPPLFFAGATLARAAQYQKSLGRPGNALTALGAGFLFVGYKSYDETANHRKVQYAQPLGAIVGGSLLLMSFVQPFKEIPKLARSISTIGMASCVYFFFRNYIRAT